jgi:hypothetical protein
MGSWRRSKYSLCSASPNGETTEEGCRLRRERRRGEAVRGAWPEAVLTQGCTQMDLFYVLVTLVFFAIAAAYVRGCERL